MSENCSHDCGNCSANCSERNLKEKPHKLSKIKKVIAVMSSKGGVGKSLVTSLLATASKQKNFNTAVLDADITGPSIPMVFGVNDKIMGNDEGMLPAISSTGVSVMSLNLLIKNATDPVVWRGPVISSAVKQFWTDVIWGDIDYMFIDMPPGTGDVPLTVFQSLPIDGIVIVSTPQDLVGMIVEKAVNMVKMLDLPIVGIVENMSYIQCPDCDKKISIFGESKVDKIAEKFEIKNIAKLPVQPEIATLCDTGKIETIKTNPLSDFFDNMIKKL